MVVIRDVQNMFWGITIDAGKRYSQVVAEGFHVSMAALEKKAKENVQVMLQHVTSESEYLLCTLNENVLQQALDLNFAPGEEISFSLNGQGVVHLTGYLMGPDEEFDSFSEDEDEEPPSLVDASGDSFSKTSGKRKAQQPLSKSKKIKLLEDVDSDDEDDSEDEDFEGDSEEEEEFSDDFEGDSYFDEDDSEEDSEEDEDDSEEETPAKKNRTPAKSPKAETPVSQKKAAAKTEAKSPKAEAKTPKQDQKSPAKQSAETPKQKGTQAETPSTPVNGESEKKKKKKKKKKKNKDGDESMDQSTASTPGTTPTTTPKKDNGTPKSENTPKKRVVSGGTIVEDLKVGHGPEAKPGKMVSVYYSGTLAKNNKRFDSCLQGKPFRFRLNQGEVIKGWDTGVSGMKVGGKRKLTVPASQGYGNMKQGPIPPNSTLVFEVELKAVS